MSWKEPCCGISLISLCCLWVIPVKCGAHEAGRGGDEECASDILCKETIASSVVINKIMGAIVGLVKYYFQLSSLTVARSIRALELTLMGSAVVLGVLLVCLTLTVPAYAECYTKQSNVHCPVLVRSTC